LAEVQAITGVAGKDLDALGKKARESAKEFGGTATDSLNTYKTILSRLGPDIAKDQKALGDMEKNVRTLSKTMGGDALGAVDALTTGMLQYGVDLSNPAKAQKEMANMMNVMAAGAQAGAAEVPSISAALKVSGVAAKQAKVSFEETNAALQALATGGKQGSEAGVALRNVLGKMAGEDVLPKEAAEKLKRLGVDMRIVSDTTLPFTTRLRELKKASSDATIMAQVFGTENAAAANILLDTVDAQDKLTKQITGTNSAVEQASVIMETHEEKVSRMNASIEDAKIAFFEATGGAFAYLEPIGRLSATMSSFLPLFSGAAKAVKWFGNTKLVQTGITKAATAAQWLWNAALTANPIGLVVVAIGALVGGIYATVKAFNASTVAQKANAEITKEVNSQMASETAQLKVLFTQLKNTNPGTEERTKLVDELKNKYPELLEQYDLESMKLSEIDKVQKDVIKNMRERITQNIKMQKAEELLKEAEEAKDKHAFQLNLYTNEGKWEYIRELQAEADKLIGEAQGIKGKKTKPSKPNKSKDLKMGDEKTDEKKGITPPIVSPAGTGKEKTIQGAGGEVKNINVRIDTLIKEFTISTSNLTEGASAIREQVTKAIVGAVRDVEVAL